MCIRQDAVARTTTTLPDPRRRLTVKLDHRTRRRAHYPDSGLCVWSTRPRESLPLESASVRLFDYIKLTAMRVCCGVRVFCTCSGRRWT